MTGARPPDVPAISVVIPAYCASADIAVALESVTSQRYRDIEIIVVMPGFSRAFYDRAAAIPPALKKDDALYRLMLGTHFPNVARLPICSSGRLLPGAAGGGWTYRWL